VAAPAGAPRAPAPAPGAGRGAGAPRRLAARGSAGVDAPPEPFRPGAALRLGGPSPRSRSARAPSAGGRCRGTQALAAAVALHASMARPPCSGHPPPAESPRGRSKPLRRFPVFDRGGAPAQKADGRWSKRQKRLLGGLDAEERRTKRVFASRHPQRVQALPHAQGPSRQSWRLLEARGLVHRGRALGGHAANGRLTAAGCQKASAIAGSYDEGVGSYSTRCCEICVGGPPSPREGIEGVNASNQWC
jgi:hypothetical protein